MKRSTQSLVLLFLNLALFGLGAPMAQAEPVRVDILLVKAGDGEGGVDASLKAYAATLERLFRFKSYSLEGRKSLRMEVPGEDVASLAQGQSLSLKAELGSGRGLKAEVEWKRGSTSLLHTRISLNRGSPAVLGGPRSKDGTWLLILQLK